MIVGDPFYFALQFDVVGTWNSPGDIWKNGLFYLYIDGSRVFDVVDVLELRTTVGFYRNLPIENSVFNNTNIDNENLFRSADAYFFGDLDIITDGLINMTCTAMADRECYLFLLRAKNKDRLIWSADGGCNIKGVVLPSGTVSAVLDELRMFCL